MIIDSHTHIFPDDIARKAIPKLMEAAHGDVTAYTDATYHGLISSMDKAGIDYSLILPIATSPEHGKGILKWIKSVYSQNKRLMFFASLHALDNNNPDHLKQICDLGIKGLKIHPQYQDTAVNSLIAMKLYEQAAKHQLILYFHAGFDIAFPQSDHASIPRFQEVLSEFPQTTMILAHAGGYREWDSVYDNLLAYPNAYFDLAFVLDYIAIPEQEKLRLMLTKIPERILFGTDSPWRDQKKDVEDFMQLECLSLKEKQQILSENFLKLIPVP
jgi:hypothetical protein